MDGKQLRNSILQWAIQGKLVPQDPNDEPASVLLERIREEKARLVKEKKIKRDKNESIIYRGEDNSYYEKFADGKVICIDDEIPFEIPDGWEWCRFSNIYWLLTDGTHNTPKYTTSGVPFLSVKDMSSGALSFSDTKFISEEEHNALTLRCNPQKGDLLISKVGSTGIPLIIDTDRQFSIFVSLALIKFFKKEIDSEFLVHLIKSPFVQEQVKENTRGVGNKNWVLTAISRTLLIIPPHNEQKRIVNAIVKLEPLCERYSKAQMSLDTINETVQKELRKSILYEAIQGRLVEQDPSDEPASVMLEHIRDEKQRLVKGGRLKKSALQDSVIYRGDDNKYWEKRGKEIVCIDDEIPFDVPDSWSWSRLGSIFSHCTGKALNSSNNKGTPLQYITTSNLYWDRFELGTLRTMPFTDEELDKCTITKGDLLVCEGGDVGRAAIWNYDFDMRIQNHIHKLRSYIPLCTKFFYYVFFLYKHSGLIGGKGIGIKGLSSSALHDLLIPVPPINEQERIVIKIEWLWQVL